MTRKTSAVGNDYWCFLLLFCGVVVVGARSEIVSMSDPYFWCASACFLGGLMSRGSSGGVYTFWRKKNIVEAFFL